jgi:hypothetical protein
MILLLYLGLDVFGAEDLGFELLLLGEAVLLLGEVLLCVEVLGVELLG